MGEVTACQQPQKRGSKAVLLLLLIKNQTCSFLELEPWRELECPFQIRCNHISFYLLSSHLIYSSKKVRPVHMCSSFRVPLKHSNSQELIPSRSSLACMIFFHVFYVFYVKIYTISMKFILSKRTPNKKDTKKEKKSHIPKGV